MSPSNPPYTSLPSTSLHSPHRPHAAKFSGDADELGNQELGRGERRRDEAEEDEEEGDGDGREGLLSGAKREEERGVVLSGKDKEWLGRIKVRWCFGRVDSSASEGVKKQSIRELTQAVLGYVRARRGEEERPTVDACTPQTPQRRPANHLSPQMPTFRTTLLSLLAGLVVLALGFLFHPSSPFSSPSSDSYYSGAPLAPGTYSSDGILASNPLPGGGTSLFLFSAEQELMAASSQIRRRTVRFRRRVESGWEGTPCVGGWRRWSQGGGSARIERVEGGTEVERDALV